MRWLKVTAIVKRGADPATEEEVLINSDHVISIAGDANGSQIYVNGPSWAAPTISSTCTPDPEQSFPDPSRAERVGTVECSGSASNLLGSYPQGRTGRPRSQQEGPVRAAE